MVVWGASTEIDLVEYVVSDSVDCGGGRGCWSSVHLAEASLIICLKDKRSMKSQYCQQDYLTSLRQVHRHRGEEHTLALFLAHLKNTARLNILNLFNFCLTYAGGEGLHPARVTQKLSKLSLLSLAVFLALWWGCVVHPCNHTNHKSFKPITI